MQWLQEHAGDYYVSSVTIGELVCGIERLDQGRKRHSLEAWLKITLDRLEGRVLAFNTRIAIEWGRLVAQLEPRGVQLSVADGQIAESGTHAELIQAGGVYSKLYEMSVLGGDGVKRPGWINPGIAADAPVGGRNRPHVGCGHQ